MEVNGIFLVFLVLIILLFLGILSSYLIQFLRKPKDDSAHYARALEALLDGDQRAGIQKLKDTIRKNTENVEAYIRLGIILRNQGAYTNGLKIHKEVLLRKNLSTEYREKLFLAMTDDYFKIGNYVLALKYLDRFEKEIRVIKYKIKAFENLNRFDDAYNLLKSNPELHPSKDNQLALYRVLKGNLLVDKKEEKEARIAYKEAQKHEPYNPGALIGLGDSYWREDRKDEAIDKWAELCENNPEMAYLSFSRLEKAAYEMGEFENLLGFYQSLSRKHPKLVSPLIALSQIYRKKGEYDSSLKVLGKALQLEPDNLNIRALQVKVWIRKGDEKQAAKAGLDLLRAEVFDKEKQYVCSNCGYVNDDVLWYCPECSAWNTFIN